MAPPWRSYSSNVWGTPRTIGPSTDPCGSWPTSVSSSGGPTARAEFERRLSCRDGRHAAGGRRPPTGAAPGIVDEWRGEPCCVDRWRRERDRRDATRRRVLGGPVAGL